MSEELITEVVESGTPVETQVETPVETSNTDLQVLDGNKIIEVKNSGINKGSAALRWISKEDWEFILAIGDDWTDEDIFKVLPERAYSIKVGSGSSSAMFNLSTPYEVRSILKELQGGRKS